MKTLRLVYKTRLPDGLHWAHLDPVQYKEANTSVPIAMHPYITAMEHFWSEVQLATLATDYAMPLFECQIFMDKELVLRFYRVDNERIPNVVEETFPYSLPVDPLCIP
jgi:hypothetical protein